MNLVVSAVRKSVCYYCLMVKSLYSEFIICRRSNIFYGYADHPLLFKICCPKSKEYVVVLCMLLKSFNIQKSINM